MKFDDILSTVGEFGRYQIIIFLLVCVITIPNAFHSIGIVFIGGAADHWCAVPEWKGENCSSWGLDPAECAAAKRAASIPSESNTTNSSKLSQCEMYNVSASPFMLTPLPEHGNSTYSSLSTEVPFSFDDFHSRDVIPCSSGWEHDRSTYASTINMDFNLVCQNEDLTDVASILWFVGVLLGSIACGFTSDIFGRCFTMWVSNAVLVIVGIATAFSPNFWTFVVLRMIIAMANTGAFISCFVLGTEFVGPSKRVLVGNGPMVSFSIGYVVLSLLAYLIRDWRHLQLAISIPLVGLFLLVPFFPESARWLMSRGKIERASSIIKKVAKTNKVKLPDPIFSESDIEEMKKGEKKGNVTDLFRTPNLCKESFNLMFNWSVESLVYYGLSLSSGDFGVNAYVSAFVSGAVEIPAYISSVFALEYFGRRRSTCGYLLLAGIACIIAIFCPIGPLRATFAMVGKFGVSASFSIIYMYTAELYPTPVRTVGLGVCSMASRIGGILAPTIRILGRTWKPLPSIIFGLSSISAGLLALLLPETRGRKLPETIEEGENLRNSPLDTYVEVPTKDIQNMNGTKVEAKAENGVA
ncbi:organic cation transporter protein-like [Diadema antillarum]|uniref:organic cation transporter protein-like n=1 Tax=Diadema antillarum TaxID=105358 RepID=UPI003A8C1720